MTIRALALAVVCMFLGIIIGFWLLWHATMPSYWDEQELNTRRLNAEASQREMEKLANEAEAENRKLRAELDRVRAILAPLPPDVAAELGGHPDPWTIFNFRREQILTHRQRRARIIKALDEWARSVDTERRSLAQISPAELGLSDAEFQALRHVLGR